MREYNYEVGKLEIAPSSRNRFFYKLLYLSLDRSEKRRSARTRGSIIKHRASKEFCRASDVAYPFAHMLTSRLDFFGVTQPLVVDGVAHCVCSAMRCGACA